MLNVSCPSLNDLQEVHAQERLLADLDAKYKTTKNFSAPLIIVDGKVNLMMSPAVYSSLLMLNAILVEKRRFAREHGATADKVDRQGAVPVSPLSSASGQTNNHRAVPMERGWGSHAAAAAVGLRLNQILSSAGADEVRQALVDIAEEDTLTSTDLAQMSEAQLEITKKFSQLHWEKAIDSLLLDANAERTTLINQQKYVQDTDLLDEIKQIRAKRAARLEQTKD